MDRGVGLIDEEVLSGWPDYYPLPEMPVSLGNAQEATKTVEDLWLAWAGNPKRVYLDPAGEFRSDGWIDFLQSINAEVFLTTGPWQRGRVEKHGDTLKHMLHRLDTESIISNEQQFDKALLACCQAKNCLVRKDGYSPDQIVLGKAVSVPGSNTSDEASASHLLAVGQDMEAELHRQRLDLRNQKEYVHHIPHIDIGRYKRQIPQSLVTEQERTKLRGLVGSLQFAVTHTRPDLAARVGELQGQITRANVQTLLDANRVLREAQQHDDVSIFYLPIPPDQITFASFGDASFASSKNLNSHQGTLVCATDKRLEQNLEAPLSPLVWISKKIPRVVRSTLSAEAYSMSKAVDVLGWVRSLWGCVHIHKFPWHDPFSSYKLMRRALLMTDRKSLFDLVTRLATPACEEYRTTLEILLIKQRIEEHTSCKWIPTTIMPADCLTKSMDPSLLRT